MLLSLRDHGAGSWLVHGDDDAIEQIQKPLRFQSGFALLTAKCLFTNKSVNSQMS
jgi:hypothetical protein